MAGRPTKYSPETVKAITDALRSGNTQRAACAYAGIHVSSFQNWLIETPRLEQDTDDTYDSSYFSQAIEKAEADFQVFCMATIKKASVESWQAAAWCMERKYPDDYGRNITVKADRRLEEALAALFPDDAGESPPSS